MMNQDTTLTDEQIQRLVAQQSWIQYTICISFLTSVLLGGVLAGQSLDYLNVLDMLVLPWLLTVIGKKKKYFVGYQYDFSRLWSFNVTTYVFGKVAVLSYFLIQNTLYRGLSLFLLSHVVYYTGEFLFVLFCHFTELTWNSFLINQSWSYGAAMSVCVIEYILELIFYPQIKQIEEIVFIGVGLNIIGHFFRLGSFCSARSNFHHMVQWRKAAEHKLVTTGVYSISRHPGYLGWFIFTLSSQMLLVNPLSFLMFIPVSWYFFYERIAYEEIYLEEFFQEEYRKYRERVPTWIPFIDGCSKRKREALVREYQLGNNSD